MKSDFGARKGRRAGHIRIQFFGEALLLALLGGGSGILIGWLVTIGYARLQGWPVDIPIWVAAGGMVATLAYWRHRRPLPRPACRPPRANRSAGVDLAIRR